MGTIGNTFDKTTKSWKRAERVWREIRHRYPAGGVIANTASFAGQVIPAGTPAVLSNYGVTVVPNAKAYDATATYAVGEATINSNKLYVCKTAITAGETFTSSKWTEITSVDGFTQEDAVIVDENTVATATVVYDGELYAYMYDSAAVAILKGICPSTIKFVE